MSFGLSSPCICLEGSPTISLSPLIFFRALVYEVSDQPYFNLFSKLITLQFRYNFYLGWNEVDKAFHYSAAILESLEPFLSCNASITWDPMIF